jgi:hypothetical protein
VPHHEGGPNTSAVNFVVKVPLAQKNQNIKICDFLLVVGKEKNVLFYFSTAIMFYDVLFNLIDSNINFLAAQISQSITKKKLFADFLRDSLLRNFSLPSNKKCSSLIWK